MAFDFGSDILVDAMRAADPARAAEARLKLEQLSAQAKAQHSASPNFKLGSSNRSAASSPARSGVGQDADVMQKFEAVVLSTFVQAMMPKNASSVFGKGLAGDMWKAQMAEKIADQISKGGGIGIASRLLADYQRVGDQIAPISGLRDPAEAVKKSRSTDAATQFLQKTELDQFLKSKNPENDGNMILHSAGRLRDV